MRNGAIKLAESLKDSIKHQENSGRFGKKQV